MQAVPFQATHSLPPISNPGMITEEEEQLYFHLASSFWSDERFYLEFGTWLGRSTTRICQGLEAAAPGRWHLNCYDLFRWNADHIPKAERAGIPDAVSRLRVGDSFRDAFLSLMGDYRHRISTFQGAVKDAPSVLSKAFAPEAKLGVLFVDASKGWDNGQLLKAVARHLAPDTRIVFQDFFMNSAAQLQLLIMLLPQLVPETVVTNGGSIVLRVVDDISPDDPLFQSKSFETLEVGRIHAACDRLEATIPHAKYDHASLVLTRPLLLWKRGYQVEAHQAVAKLALSAVQRDAIRNRTLRYPVLKIPPVTAILDAKV